MLKKIPIFALNIVVFPSSKYPLHIFEERYKKMINKCLHEHTGFGIVTRIDNELSKIGSYVEIEDILKKFDNGEMDISVAGKGRFFIDNVYSNPDNYLVAEVSEYEDLTSEVNPSLLSELQSSFERLIEKTNFQLEDAFWRNYEGTGLKSFKLAEKSGLSLKQQQSLLTFRDEKERVNYLIEHYENLEKQISESSTVRSIVMSDGYINN
ncbi:MAG TPA: LON peptidase substrate-binding domain-containing protein [Ignavibacteriaceae bacterium]|jgi:Lon protease-like protein|nr:LON peptidase substrate-binding domain-containing protein [Ignavibacteriaceae bacterium]